MATNKTWLENVFALIHKEEYRQNFTLLNKDGNQTDKVTSFVCNCNFSCEHFTEIVISKVTFIMGIFLIFTLAAAVGIIMFFKIGMKAFHYRYIDTKDCSSKTNPAAGAKIAYGYRTWDDMKRSLPLIDVPNRSICVKSKPPKYPGVRQRAAAKIVSRSSSVTELQNFEIYQRDALAAHNIRRTWHGVPPLALKKDLNHIAENYAVRIANDNSFDKNNKISGGWSIGGDIAIRYSITRCDYSGEKMTEVWYREGNNYDFKRHSVNNDATAHFTQLIWESTVEMGIRRIKSRADRYIVVATYRPAGNIAGEFRYNVFAPKHI